MSAHNFVDFGTHSMKLIGNFLSRASEGCREEATRGGGAKPLRSKVKTEEKR